MYEMVKPLKMDPKPIDAITLNVSPKIVSLALGHEVVDFGCFTPIKLMIGLAMPQKSNKE